MCGNQDGRGTADDADDYAEVDTSGELTITVLAEKMDLKKAMRIHFAGQAMAAFIQTNPSCADWVAMASDSVQAADALIAELEKTESKS